ncbi:MAG: hypothetical protein ABGX16_05785 [Pirellulales bacterium]
MSGHFQQMRIKSMDCCFLGLLVAVVSSIGCGSDMPFDLVPVQGKVTYEDGSLIQTDSILVTFNPVNPKREGKMIAPGGQTYANVVDGTFAGVSSRRPNDGLVLGRHQVVVVSFASGREGPIPTDAVPRKYHKMRTTPLEVEVTSSNQFLEIQVSKE